MLNHTGTTGWFSIVEPYHTIVTDATTVTIPMLARGSYRTGRWQHYPDMKMPYRNMVKVSSRWCHSSLLRSTVLASSGGRVRLLAAPRTPGQCLGHIAPPYQSRTKVAECICLCPSRYRLERGNGNPFVRGWDYASSSSLGFWGQCDIGAPANTVRRSVQYRWEPSGSKRMLADFSPEKFCSLTARRGLDIMLVGDSLTGELFISLLALLDGTFTREHRPARSRSIERGDSFVQGKPTQEFRVDAEACAEASDPYKFPRASRTSRNGRWGPRSTGPFGQQPLSLSFYRNEYLVTNAVEPSSAYRHEYPWVQNVTKRSLVLLQVSSWFRRAAVSVFEKNLHLAFAEIRNRIGHSAWAKQVVLFSSSMPSAENCHNITDWPLSKAVNFTGLRHHKYGWNKVEALDRIGERMAMQVGASFIDLSTPLSHRPDGHMRKECSHWCLPGAYDIGPQLLLNALMGRIGEPIGML